MHDVALDVRRITVTPSTEAALFGQRLKRMSRMIEKIALHSAGLERLQDVGGCRVVFPAPDLLTPIADAFKAEFGVKQEYDYVLHPRSSGYRAIHLVHERNGRLIEIQLRSAKQHHWAEVVEKAEEITGFALKDEQGPRELLEYFRVAAEILALEESGEPVDTGLVEQIGDLRERIRPYYRQAGTSS